MSITALDIQQQGFEHALRGYDVEQVDVFLERVAQEVDKLTRENEELKQKLIVAQEAAATISPEEKAEFDKAIARAQQAEAQVKDSNARAQEAFDKIADLEKRLEERNDTAAAISEAFISAQRSADALKEEARAEGERIYRESEAKAREFIREALVEKQRILNETEALTGSCSRFREEYQILISRFAAEAETRFSEINPPQVDDASVSAMLPDMDRVASNVSFEEDAADRIPDMIPALNSDVADLDIEEID